MLSQSIRFYFPKLYFIPRDGLVHEVLFSRLLHVANDSFSYNFRRTLCIYERVLIAQYRH